MIGPKGERLEESLISELDARVVFHPAEDTPRLALIPKNLLNALWLQLAQVLTSETAVKSCLYCNELFEVGPGTGRRADARYCI